MIRREKPTGPPACPHCRDDRQVKTLITFRNDRPVSLAKDAPPSREVTGYRCEACSHEWRS